MLCLDTLTWYPLMRYRLAAISATLLPSFASPPATADLDASAGRVNVQLFLSTSMDSYLLTIPLPERRSSATVPISPFVSLYNEGERLRAFTDSTLSSTVALQGEVIVPPHSTAVTVPGSGRAPWRLVTVGGAMQDRHRNTWLYFPSPNVQEPIPSQSDDDALPQPRSTGCGIRKFVPEATLGSVLLQPMITVAQPRLIADMRALLESHLDKACVGTESVDSPPKMKAVSDAVIKNDAGLLRIRLLPSGADSIIPAGSTLDMRVSKMLLRQRSDAFAVMMSSRMMESQSNDVTLNDVCVPAFLTMLHFLYTGEIDLSMIHVAMAEALTQPPSLRLEAASMAISKSPANRTESAVGGIGAKRARSPSGSPPRSASPPARAASPSSRNRQTVMESLRSVWRRIARPDTADFESQRAGRGGRDSSRPTSQLILGDRERQVPMDEVAATRAVLNRTRATPASASPATVFSSTLSSSPRGQRLMVSPSVQELASRRVAEPKYTREMYFSAPELGFTSSLTRRAHLFFLSSLTLMQPVDKSQVAQVLLRSSLSCMKSRR